MVSGGIVRHIFQNRIEKTYIYIMALTETQRALATSLIDIQAPHEWIVSMILFLQEDEEAMTDLMNSL